MFLILITLPTSLLEILGTFATMTMHSKSDKQLHLSLGRMLLRACFPSLGMENRP
jgi:hypothetical protein